MKPPADVSAYYDWYPEEARLTTGPFRLEFERTKEILLRTLPAPPATIVDVGGAAGAYSLWLADRGYEVHLVDASPRLIEEARRRSAASARPLASVSVGDARALPQKDNFAAVVLLMGPLYHLTSEADRRAALLQACRVSSPGGLIAAAAISRCASTLDGLARKRTADPAFARIRDRDLVDGQHRNDVGHPEYFTTAYFHRPVDLQSEVEEAGFENVRVLGVEGAGWILPDFDERWSDPLLRHEMLDSARVLESEPSVVGMSAHLLALGWRPRRPGS